MRVRTESFAVHSYEVDASGTLSVPALAGYLQEVAGLHAEEMGCGMRALRDRGLTWVLSRLRVEVDRAVAMGDVLEVTTWPSGVERIFAVRDFRARARDGAEVARAMTRWLVIDLESRRPVRPQQVLEARDREPQEHVFSAWPGEVPGTGAWEEQKRFRTRYQDIDQNLHVNNTSYVAWALEAVPLETWRATRLAALEAEYLAEARHPSTVLSRAARAGEGRFLHAVVREEDGKELARLETRWAPRDG